MTQPMTAERLAEQVSAAFAETIGVNLTPDELAHVMEPVRAEVSRLAAERDEALKTLEEANNTNLELLNDTAELVVVRKQLATLAAENERLRAERDKFEKWYHEAVAVISTVYHITGTIEGGSEIESAKRMAAALAAAAATIDELKQERDCLADAAKIASAKDAATIERQRAALAAALQHLRDARDEDCSDAEVVRKGLSREEIEEMKSSGTFCDGIKAEKPPAN